MSKARGTLQLVFDTADAVAELVHDVHRSERERALRHLEPLSPVADAARAVATVHRVATDTWFGTFRTALGGARAVSERLLDAAVSVHATVASARPERSALARTSRGSAHTPVSDAARGSTAWWRDHAEATLNAFWGDHLERRSNALDLGLDFRVDGVPTPAARLAAALSPNEPIAVFVHGLGTTEWSWSANASAHWGDPTRTFGTELRRELGHQTVYVRYNTGRPILANACALSDALDALWTGLGPGTRPVVLVGHSMGGLVVRRAASEAQANRAAWVRDLTDVVTIGSPLRGAPLAKVAEHGTRAMLAVGAGAAIPGRLLDSRSAGVRDLYGGEAHDPVALDDVATHSIASTVTASPEHLLGWLVGDAMVRVPSALGGSDRTSALLPGLDHLSIANHPTVYEALLAALSADRD